MLKAALAALVLFVGPVARAADTLFEQAQEATREKNYKEAIKVYGAILSMHGEDSAVRHNLALIYIEIGDIARARQEAKRAIELKSKEGRFVVTLAVTYLVGEKPNAKRARSILRKAVRLLKKGRDYDGLANAYYNLGVIAQRRRDLIEARRLYEVAIGYNPADERIRLVLDALPSSTR